MPRYEDGFFPHYTRDLNASFMDGLMTHFEDLQNTSNYSKKGKKDIDTVIREINSYVDGHTIGRAEDYDYNAPAPQLNDAPSIRTGAAF